MIEPLSQEERLAWLALHRINGIGSRLFFKLLSHFGSARDVFNARSKTLRALGLPETIVAAIRKPHWDEVDQESVWALTPDQHIILFADPSYPTLLKEISSPPPVLYIKGSMESFAQPQVAIVGSRNPTHYGNQNAFNFANALATQGLCITSGMALGIDAKAHEGALHGSQFTIAVQGSGLLQLYPKRHHSLAEKIMACGALVSEFPLHAEPHATHFPKRNRIISGLCIATVVVEATLKSGSLITAHCAIDQGREVFAIPGAINNPLARGCHALIQQGAALVESPEDILVALQHHPLIPAHHSPSPDLDESHQKLLECVGFEPTTIDELVQRSEQPAATVASMLLILEFNGYIKTGPYGYVRAAPLA